MHLGLHMGKALFNCACRLCSICSKILGSERWLKLGKLYLCKRKEKRRSEGLGKWHGCYFFILFNVPFPAPIKITPFLWQEFLPWLWSMFQRRIDFSFRWVSEICRIPAIWIFFFSLSSKLQYSCMGSSYSLRKTLYIMWLEISFELCCIFGRHRSFLIL